MGVRAEVTEREMLAGWAADGDETLVASCQQALCDGAPGGALLANLAIEFPGRTSVVLGVWRDRIEGRAKPRERSARRRAVATR